MIETDVFKMVSLRSASAGAVTDPTSETENSSVVPILRTSGVNPLNPAPEIVDRLPVSAILGNDVLSRTRANLIAKRLGTQDDIALADLAAIRDAEPSLVDAGAFRREYTGIVDSWLVSFLKGDKNQLALHERLISVSRLWLQYLSDPRPLAARGAIGDILTSRVVFPRALRTKVVAQKPRDPKTDTSVGKDKARYAKLLAEHDQNESIQRKAHKLYWDLRAEESEARTASERSSRSRATLSRASVVPKLDQAFFTRLDAKLTPAESARLVTLSGGSSTPLSARNFHLDDFVGDLLNVNGLIYEANDICSKIRIYEQNELASLPAPKALQAQADRPSVRAIGWGDLVVARERLVGYEAGAIAHIENILSGEEKVREHERKLTTEQISETVTVTEDTSERDLQTTDRHELQNNVSTVIQENFSIKAGVDTSGRYGLTKVNTSLDASFDRGSTESRSSTMQVAQEIVAKTVEKTFESVREQRRLTVTEAIREANNHTLRNLAGENGIAPPSISGVYYWLEKVQEVALRHYGTRLMVEFHIPEPGLSLFSSAQTSTVDVPKPAPFTIGPQDVEPTNYLCIAKAYGAIGIEPPPSQFIQVGYTWRSEPDEEADGDTAEDTISASVPIPAGYQPISGRASITSVLTDAVAADKIYLYVAVGGREVIDGRGYSQDADWRIDQAAQWPNGVPVSMLSHGQWDKTLVLHVTLRCERTTEAMNAWRLRTWEKVREAYERMVQDYQRAVLEAQSQSGALFQISGRNPEINRQIERDELKKWSIKTMRIDSFDDALVDAVVQVGEHPEVDPVASDAQAPIVRFFEESFEWREMSYFLYPYFWGRRNAWNARRAIATNDPTHDQFLQAGAARVIVPVTPGYEERVLHYLDTDPAAPELERITSPAPGEIPSNAHSEQLWLDLLLEKNNQLALGSGTLSVVAGSDSVQINAESRWEPSTRDLGRELFITGDKYVVAEVFPQQRQVKISPAYAGPSGSAVVYATGSVPFGTPWLVRVPTSLVILKENLSLVV